MKVFANQSSSSILMIRPQLFDHSLQSLSSISFKKTQKSVPDKDKIRNAVSKEFNDLVLVLQKNEIEIVAYEETKLDLNNAFFLNNWISFHEDGTIILYPAKSIQQEWRSDLIISLQKKDYDIKQILDFTHHEKEKQCLEGSAKLIFDNLSRTIYSLKSPLSCSDGLKKLADFLEYDLLEFCLKNGNKNTWKISSVLTLSDKYALLCSSIIKSKTEHDLLVRSLTRSGREIIITEGGQSKAIGGNILELRNSTGESILVMSQTAYSALKPDQIERITQYSRIVPVQMQHMELFGNGILRGIMSVISLPKLAFA